jgi:3-deoxy-D-manno-octulosonic-acid transferase
MTPYDLGYYSIAPLFLANAYYKRWRYGKYRQSLPGMFGANRPNPPLEKFNHRVWLHSVSVGETVAAGALFKPLREQKPKWEYLSTTTTETGQDQAKKSLKEANYFDFAPADLSWNVRNFLNAYQPSIYLFFETEVWPNLLTQCGQRHMPVFMVNGKLSEKSLKGYSLARPLLRKALSQVTAFLMQTEDDAARMKELVGPEAQIYVTGNVKFDHRPPPLTPEERDEIRLSFGVDQKETLLFLAGSTHPGEEKDLYEAFLQYKEKGGPLARLVIAPRHPERFESVKEELEKLGAKVHRATDGNLGAESDAVVILNKMGVLARYFGAADIALVGGAWNPIGGHNLLEASSDGIPVLHGPHMHAQKEIMRIMKEHRASKTVSIPDLGEELFHLASSPADRHALGEKGRTAVEQNLGAAEKSLEIIFSKMTS